MNNLYSAARRKFQTLIRTQSYHDSILALELTDFCNCNCIMCSQSAVKIIHGSSKGFMSADLVAKIVDDLSAHSVQVGKLLPFGLGESLLHPEFIKIMKKIFDNNRDKRLFQTIDLHTNAIQFSEEIQDFFLEYPDQINTLSFSLDAVRPETYQKIRRNRCLEKAYQNIESFIKKRGKRRPPQLHFQFIVMDENAHEAKEFLNYWSDVLRKNSIDFQVNYDWHPPMIKDTIFFKRLNPFNNSDLPHCEALHRQVAESLGLVEDSKNDDRIIKSDEYIDNKHKNNYTAEISEQNDIVDKVNDESNYDTPNSVQQNECVAESVSAYDKNCSIVCDSALEKPVTKRRPCSGPWKYQSISWDGEVTVCCIDTGRELSIGNVNKSMLTELWDSEKINNYRLWHIRGEFENMPKCTICRNLDSPMLSNDEVIAWLKSKGLEGEIGRFLKRVE